MQLDHLVRMTVHNLHSQATVLMLHAFLSVQDCISGTTPTETVLLHCGEPV